MLRKTNWEYSGCEKPKPKSHQKLLKPTRSRKAKKPRSQQAKKPRKKPRSQKTKKPRSPEAEKPRSQKRKNILKTRSFLAVVPLLAGSHPARVAAVQEAGAEHEPTKGTRTKSTTKRAKQFKTQNNQHNQKKQCVSLSCSLDHYRLDILRALFLLGANGCEAYNLVQLL